jgi:Holliday junction DNA helicase RuvA
MIAQVSGTLVSRELDRVEVMTASGVAYELAIPLGVYESLPATGEPVLLHTHLVVKEDGWQLFGFATTFERRVFQRVLNAKGVGPALALGLLSTLTAERLIRALRDKDVVTLQSVPRVGRKKAEQLILDLADKLDDLQVNDRGSAIGDRRSTGGAAQDAARALVSLGYSTGDAERAVREAVDGGASNVDAAELIRSALARIRG